MKKIYRNFALSARSAGQEEEGACIVEGYASTFGEPYLLGRAGGMEVWEQVDAHAFDGADMSDVIFQYNHEGRVFARVSNGTLEIRTDPHGLYVRADLSGTEEGRKLYHDIKGGYITRMSFAFDISQEDSSAYNGRSDAVIWTIAAVGRVYDVSAVSIPANPGTEISARMAEYAQAAAAAGTAPECRDGESGAEPGGTENAADSAGDASGRERLLFLLESDLKN